MYEFSAPGIIVFEPKKSFYLEYDDAVILEHEIDKCKDDEELEVLLARYDLLFMDEENELRDAPQ